MLCLCSKRVFYRIERNRIPIQQQLSIHHWNQQNGKIFNNIVTNWEFDLVKMKIKKRWWIRQTDTEKKKKVLTIITTVRKTNKNSNWHANQSTHSESAHGVSTISVRVNSIVIPHTNTLMVRIVVHMKSRRRYTPPEKCEADLLSCKLF